jgi:berberine-like enzyme
VPGLVLTDAPPSAASGNIYYATNVGEAGQVLHGYQSLWLPASLLAREEQVRFADALFAASRHRRATLHVNKGLAGRGAATRDTATDPQVLDAFALLISAAHGPPADAGIANREPDVLAARLHAAAIRRAVGAIEQLVPRRACYLAESNFFDQSWRQSFWRTNDARLLEVKDTYDPDGLFIVHHGVGSERSSGDGFTRL